MRYLESRESLMQTKLRCFVLVAACLGVVAATGSVRAQAAPEPEAAPRGYTPALRPLPAPGASSPKPLAAGSYSRPSPTSQRSSGSAAVPTQYVSTHSRASKAVKHTSSRTAKQRTSKARVTARRRAPSSGREASSLGDLRPSPKSYSAFLLAAGLLLVLLVIGETAFLGVAGSRFGLSARPRSPGRGSLERSRAIRQVPLQR